MNKNFPSSTKCCRRIKIFFYESSILFYFECVFVDVINFCFGFNSARTHSSRGAALVGDAIVRFARNDPPPHPISLPRT